MCCAITVGRWDIDQSVAVTNVPLVRLVIVVVALTRLWTACLAKENLDRALHLLTSMTRKARIAETKNRARYRPSVATVDALDTYQENVG